jgi:Tfp pilus assembly protein PilO
LSAIILGILAVGGMAYYYFMVATDTIKRIEDDIDKVKAEKTALENKIAEYDAFLARQDEIEATVEAITIATERLPSGPEDERYLELITDFIGKTAVQMNSMQEDDQRKYANFVELPNNVTGTARYNDLVQFMSLSEQNAGLFMRVAEFTVENDPATPFLHPYQLTLSTFIFNK